MTATPPPSSASAHDDARDGAPIMAVRHLSVSYRGTTGMIPAVRDVSFDLHRGEVLALVGESAAGKSTVGQAMLALLPPQSSIQGDVIYRGRALASMSGDELRHLRGNEIAMIFQDPIASLTPTIAIADQMAEVYVEHRGLDRASARAEAVELLRRMFRDAERVADSFPFQLSGGMAQRIMFAMAIALEPAVIVADEPTAALDPAVRGELLEQIEAQRAAGVGVLLITHDFGVVARLADRVAVMYAGAIVETGDARTIFQRPRHPYTMGLLQSLPSITQRGRLTPMRGQPPDLATLGAECPFLPRCPKATSICRLEPAPALAPTDTGAPGHEAACYNPIAVDRADLEA